MQFYFLAVIICLLAACSPAKINREALYERNNPKLNAVDTLGSLTVGNGRFAYTVDITGMQTFPNEYANGVPLCTMSEWGWHSFPNTENYRAEETYKNTELFGRSAPYAVEFKEQGRQREAANYFRVNPHRLNLACLGLKGISKDMQLSEISGINQQLDLWSGIINSQFVLWGDTVRVTTAAAPKCNEIATAVSSPLLKKKELGLRLRLPYPTGKHSDNATIFNDPRMQSVIESSTSNSAIIRCTADLTNYFVALSWEEDAVLKQIGVNDYFLESLGKKDVLHVVCAFTEHRPTSTCTTSDIIACSTSWWKRYWENSAAIDFSQCNDPRARELERRTVLSRYLCTVNCSGNMPPQESGLTYNTWFGRPHLEMEWWHAVHFSQWGNIDVVERHLEWYRKALPAAKKIAMRQGYEGARWMKMTDPWAGEAPSKVGSFLIWQQPHYIYLAELIYQQKPTPETLNKYADIVEQTARFMADFVSFDRQNDRYTLRGIIPAQETLSASTTINPPMELTYWHYGLSIAQQWRTRQGLAEEPRWTDIINKLSPLPQKDGLYLAAESAPDTYSNIKYHSDHPAVLAACGMLPPMPTTDMVVMRNTFNWIWDNWNWDKTWGWDYPLVAMAAIRLGEPEKAIDALLMDKRTNTYLVSGHNYQDGRLRVYLPGNGGLLSTIAMMCKMDAFPKNWDVTYEGF